MSRVDGILDYYKKNQDAIPNIDELIGALSDCSRLGDEDEKEINTLVNLEIDRLISNKIVENENDSLIKMINLFREKALSGDEVPDELEDYARVIAGVAVWLKTEYSRGATFEYENFNEYRKMMGFEDSVVLKNIQIDDSISQTKAYIDEHCNESLIRLRQRRIDSRIDKKIKYDRESNRDIIESRIMMLEKYVYPERLKEMVEVANDKFFLPFEVAMNAITDLGNGMDFALVRKGILSSNLPDYGEETVLGYVTLYAKNGPDFYEYMMEQKNVMISEDTHAILQEIREQNKEFAELSGEYQNQDSFISF